jgi:hypothetical protein
MADRVGVTVSLSPNLLGDGSEFDGEHPSSTTGASSVVLPSPDSHFYISNIVFQVRSFWFWLIIISYN